MRSSSVSGRETSPPTYHVSSPALWVHYEGYLLTFVEPIHLVYTQFFCELVKCANDKRTSRIVLLYHTAVWRIRILPLSMSTLANGLCLSLPDEGHTWAFLKFVINSETKFDWLDILCLRQPSNILDSETPREKEWAIDGSTIGLIIYWYVNVMRYFYGLETKFNPYG